MENPGIEISSVDLSNGNITVTYANGAIETLPNNKQTHHAMHEHWIRPNPPFISDKFKVEMRNLSLSCINGDQKCCCASEDFFSPPNEANVMKFLTYMRKRDSIIPQERTKWVKKV
jgi:hypothetical protein